MTQCVLVGVEEDTLGVVISRAAIGLEGEDVGSDDLVELEVGWSCCHGVCCAVHGVLCCAVLGEAGGGEAGSL